MMSAVRRRVEGMLRDPRDWVFVPLALTMSAALIPLAIYLFVPGDRKSTRLNSSHV